MPLNVIDTLKPKNGLDFPIVEAIDVFVEGYTSLADAVTHFATDAMIAAINAALAGKANASDVTTSVANLQGQINQIVISASAESVVAPEVAQARVDTEGNEYSTLKQRLDVGEGKTLFLGNQFSADNIEFVNGRYDIVEGELVFSASTKSITLSNGKYFVPSSPYKIHVINSAYKFYIYVLNRTTFEYIKSIGWRNTDYILDTENAYIISIRLDDGTDNIYPDAAKYISVYNQFALFGENANTAALLDNSLAACRWLNSGYTINNGIVTYNSNQTNRIANAYDDYLAPQQDMYITCTSDYRMYITKHSASDKSYISTLVAWGESATLATGYLYKLQLKKPNDAAINTAEIRNVFLKAKKIEDTIADYIALKTQVDADKNSLDTLETQYASFDTDKISFINGTYTLQNNELVFSENAKAITIPSGYYFTPANPCKISVTDNSYTFFVLVLDRLTHEYIRTVNWRSDDFWLDTDKSYIIIIRKNAGADNIHPEEAINVPVINHYSVFSKNAANVGLTGNLLLACRWLNSGYTLSSSTVNYNSNQPDRVGIAYDDYLEPYTDLMLTCTAEYLMYVFKFSATDKSYIDTVAAWKDSALLESGYLYKLQIKKSDNSQISIDEIKNVVITETNSETIEHDVDLLKDSSLRIDHIMVNGVWTLPTPTYDPSTTRLATPENTYLILEYDAYISVASGYQYMIFRYNDEDELVSYDSWNSLPNRLDKKYKYRFNFAKTDGTIISEEEYINLIIYSSNFAVSTIAPDIYIHSSNYQLKEDAVISKVLKDKDTNTITFGLITDTHHRDFRNARSDYQTMILNNICERVGAAFKVHLGDVIEGGKTSQDLNATDLQSYWSKAHKTFVPELYTIAHHELYGSGGAAAYGNDSTALTSSMCIGMYGLTNKYLNVVYSDDKTSWYVDIDNIRFVGLNSALPTTMDFTDSLAFLQDALESADNKAIVCFSHVPPYKYVNSGNGTAIKGDEVVSALSDYSGEVIAYFHGHTHWDNIYKPEDNPVYISTCCALATKVDISTYGCRDGNPTAYDRAVGQYSEYCFDIVNVHPDTGVIKMFRFGAGADRTYTPD